MYNYFRRDYHTVEETAEILGVSTTRVHKFIEAGLLRGQNMRVRVNGVCIGYEFMVRGSSLNYFMEEYPHLWGEGCFEPKKIKIEITWEDCDEYYDENLHRIYDKVNRMRNECMMEENY